MIKIQGEMMKKSRKIQYLGMLVLTLGGLVLSPGVYPQEKEYSVTIEETLNAIEADLKREQSQDIITEEPSPARTEVITEITPFTSPAQMRPPSAVQPTPEALTTEIPLTQETPEAPPALPSLPQPSPDVVSPQDIKIQEASPDKIIIDVLELKDMDIADVLKLISKKSGLNIVAGSNVKGKITIYLKEVDVRDALRIILESNDMAFVEEEGIIRVMTSKEFEMIYGRRFQEKTKIKIVPLKYANPSETANLLNQLKSIIGKIIADDKSNTLVLIDTPDKLEAMELFIKETDIPITSRVFDLNYAKAEDLSAKIGEVLTKNVGHIKFDARSNKIVVTDTPQRIEQIAKMVQAFDEKHKEVLIEAKIIQLILSDQYKMGVDWEAIVSNYHTLDLLSDFDILGSTSKRGKLSIGTLSKDDYTVLLEALDTVGQTNILSNPTITAINNEEAKILVGSTQPYVTTTTTTPATGATTTAESVNFIDVGVKLYVTPTIHNDDYITIKIKPEVSSVTSFLTTANNNTIPVVETSEAETMVTVKDNVTIVIGGLIKDEKIDSVNKIPLLGDIPLIGVAFRNTDKLTRKTELVIFLTPKIISGDVHQGTLLQDYSSRTRK